MIILLQGRWEVTNKKEETGSSEMGKEESWSQLDAERLFQTARGSVGEESSRTTTQKIATDWRF